MKVFVIVLVVFMFVIGLFVVWVDFVDFFLWVVCVGVYMVNFKFDNGILVGMKVMIGSDI